MKWQKIRERIVKYVHFVHRRPSDFSWPFLTVRFPFALLWASAHHRRLRLTVIVWIAGILSISLASAKGFTLEQEELRGGIFSPDGNLLVVRTEAGVLVFNTGNLLRIQKLSTQGLGVGELAFSPDSRYLAWSDEPSFRGGVRVWDLVTFTQVAYFQLNAFDITALLFVSGGELLAVQERDYISVGTPDPGTVHFWKVGTWEKHGSWGPPGSINSLAFTHARNDSLHLPHVDPWESGYMSNLL